MSIADAAAQGNEQQVRELIDSGIDVNQPQVDGMTALHWATYLDNQVIVEMLIEAGADVNAQSRYGVFPLSLACTNGSTEIVRLLLAEGADPNAALLGGETSIMTAARTGKLAPVQLLLAYGANPNARERKGQTALMWAAAEGHAEIVRTLIDAGADFLTPLGSGISPMFFAVREGHIDVVRALLHAGVDINEYVRLPQCEEKEIKPGIGPLLLAVENGHFDLAVALLEAGADPNERCAGHTALHAITWVRKPDRGDDGDPAPMGSGRRNSLQFISELVAFGADVNAAWERNSSPNAPLNLRGVTPFMLAAKRNDLPLMQLLMALGADPFRPNVDGSTPLMAAAGLGTTAPTEEAGTEPEAIEAVKFLLWLGADPNDVDRNGETAMHGAAYKSLPDVVSLLTESGADIIMWNRPNRYGWTPLSIAMGYRPGNFKPSHETINALKAQMIAAGMEPTAPKVLPKSEY